MELDEQEKKEMDQFLQSINQKYLHLIQEINVHKVDFVLFNDMYAYDFLENGRAKLGITKQK